MGSSSMKVHPFARGLWDHHQPHESPAGLSLGCKRLRPLVPKITTSSDAVKHHNALAFDLKSFIRPDCGPRKLISPSDHDKKNSAHQVETQGGGTRWNPKQEQIGILEMLYRGGMRTPNAQQIEKITEQLSKYGKIEGKNVFYWFQNHKARERQKHKRTILGLTHCPRTPPLAASSAVNMTSITLNLDTKVELEREEESPYKRKCTSWTLESSEENYNMMIRNYRDEGARTLELFPLHPEGR